MAARGLRVKGVVLETSPILVRLSNANVCKNQPPNLSGLAPSRLPSQGVMTQCRSAVGGERNGNPCSFGIPGSFLPVSLPTPLGAFGSRTGPSASRRQRREEKVRRVAEARNRNSIKTSTHVSPAGTQPLPLNRHPSTPGGTD